MSCAYSTQRTITTHAEAIFTVHYFNTTHAIVGEYTCKQIANLEYKFNNQKNAINDDPLSP